MPITRAHIGQDDIDLGLDGLAQELVAGTRINPDGSISTGQERARVSDPPSTARDLVVVYRTEGDDRVRPEHAKLEGMTWELADPSVPQPPLGYGCRCRLEIVERPSNPPDDRAQAFDRHPERDEILRRSLGADAVDAYRRGELRPDELFTRASGGDLINRHQARAIIAARAAKQDPKAALAAVARLSSMGLSGRRLDRVLRAARERIGLGLPSTRAIEQAVMSVSQRGLVNARNARRAARDIDRSGLIGTVPESSLPARPPGFESPQQLAQVRREGLPMNLDGDPPAAASASGRPPSAPIGNAVAQVVEPWIAQRTTERAVVISVQGRVIGSSEGTAGSVKLPPLPLSQYLGAVVTHNHPRRSSDEGRRWFNPLSDGDLIAARDLRLGAIRAVTPEGIVHQARPGASGWPRGIKSLIRKARDQVMQSILDDVAAGTLTQAQAGLATQHRALQQLANLGYIRYDVGRYGTR